MPIVNGTVYWASVHEPNTQFEHKWSADLFVTEVDNQALRDLGLEPKLVRLTRAGKISHTDHEVGDEYFQFKRNLTRRSGEENKPPRVVDSSNQPVPADVLVGNGSEVNIAYSTYEWNVGGNKGVSADLAGLQVLDLVEYIVDSGFTEVSGYTAPAPVEEDDPFNQ